MAFPQQILPAQGTPVALLGVGRRIEENIPGGAVDAHHHCVKTQAASSWLGSAQGSSTFGGVKTLSSLSGGAAILA